MIKRTLYSNFLDFPVNQPAIKVGFIHSVVAYDKFRGTYITFNPYRKGCIEANTYMGYNIPFYNIPISCNQCDKSCLTCTSS